MPEFSVIIPVFNSEKFIEPVYNQIAAVFESLKKSFELIFVDDGSSDRSVAEVLRLAKANESIRLVKLKKNFGQYVATVCGISQASGDFIITIDADGSPPPQAISELLNQKGEENELVYGEPNQGKRSRFRRIGSRIFDSIIRYSATASVDLSDKSGSSFRLIERGLAQKAIQKLSHPILLDLVLINHAGKKIKFVPIDFQQSASASSYSNYKLISQGIGLLFAILASKVCRKRALVTTGFIHEVV